MVIDELYTFWGYDMGVVVDVHLAEFVEYIRVIQPVTKTFQTDAILICEFLFCLGFDAHR